MGHRHWLESSKPVTFHRDCGGSYPADTGITASILIPLKPASVSAGGVGNVVINGIERAEEGGPCVVHSPVLTVFLSSPTDLLFLLPDQFISTNNLFSLSYLGFCRCGVFYSQINPNGTRTFNPFMGLWADL